MARSRRAEDLCVPIALGFGVLAFLWLSYFLYFGTSLDQPGGFVPVNAIRLNPLTLIFQHTDSLFVFSVVILGSDLILYWGLGSLVRNLLRRRAERRRQVLTQT